MMDETLTIVFLEDNHKKALLGLVIASTGASLGKKVQMFFAFDSLCFIRKDFLEISEDDKVKNYLRRLLKECKDMGIKFFACSLSFEMLNIKKEDIIDDIEIVSSIKLINSIDSGKTIFL